MTKKAWWQKNGVKFECQGSGRCCISRGEYGYVYLNLDDRKRLAAHLKLSLTSFTKRYCEKEDDFFHLKEEKASSQCQFLKENRCSIYQARPTQCRTWPFWPEHMGAKAWKREVTQFCPGVGKGRIWKPAEIQKNLKDQKEADLSTP